MFCSNCGSKINNNGNFCNSCGAKLDTNQNNVNIQNQNNSINNNVVNTNVNNSFTESQEDNSSKILLIVSILISFIYSVIGCVLIHTPYEYPGLIKVIEYVLIIIMSVITVVYYGNIVVKDKDIVKYKTSILVIGILNFILSFNVVSSVLGIIVYVINSKKSENINHVSNTNQTLNTLFIVFISLLIAVETSVLCYSVYSDYKLVKVDEQLKQEIEKIGDFDY